MCFAVDERALIPRPETEELVDWIAAEMEVRMREGRQDPLRRTWRILDIGTGSGCIPIALKKKLPEAEVWALDLSAAALELARHNATVLGAEIAFVERDIFDRGGWDSLPAFDLIVSNPPYVPEGDKAAMHRNVLDHEPHLALFVTGDDPLLFYREIAAFAKSRLDPGGLLFFEIHERMGAGIRTLLKRAGYTRVEVRQDMQGKERMSKGESPAPADTGA
jgi:release factor glutamine methyltransferase